MERSYWTDLALVVVTLGFYIPYWLWRRNRDLQEAYPDLDLPDNAWWLAGGTALSFFAAYVAFMMLPGFGAASFDSFYATITFLNMAAVVVFSIGVFVLARNGEDAADVAGIDWAIPAPLFAGLFAGAFLLVQAGNIFESWLVRGPALLMVFAQPLVFYRVYEDLEDVEFEGLRRDVASDDDDDDASPVEAPVTS